jgi:hypothetical protein
MHFTKALENLFTEITQSGKTDIYNIANFVNNVVVELNTYEHIKTLKVTQKEIIVLAENFIKIGQLFNIKFKYLSITQSSNVFVQQMNESSLTDIFIKIRDMNIHQNVDSSKHDVAFPKVIKKDICSCSYHQEELFDHLIICSIISGIHAIRKDLNVFLVILTALLHDIGKPACIRIFNDGNIGYPFHGEYGSMILSRIYNDGYAHYISKDDYEIILRCISIHMCSYHITDFHSNWNEERVNSTRIECSDVKKYLECLSYGDIFAAFNTVVENITEDKKKFTDSRKVYNQLISEEFQNDKNKFVIVVRGRSGSGKSFFSKWLFDFVTKLNLTVKHIERDMIITNVVRKIQGNTEINYRPTQDEYSCYYTYYKINKLGLKVNEQMQKEIKHSINTFDVTIIDTQLTMFQGVEQIIPSNISNCICIGIDISRNMLIDDDKKNGCEVSEQLSLFGVTDVLFPLDMNGVNIFNMSSSYTHNSKPIGMSCDFVFTFGYNSTFNAENSIGINYFSKFMKHIITYTQKLVVHVNTDNMELVDYVNYLYSSNDQSYDKVIEILKLQCYHVGCPSQLKGTSFEKQILSIKYLDHNNNWNKWGRQSRGSTLILINGSWKYFKYLMQRGAEILTGMQIKRGIEKTDNVDTTLDFIASHLDQDQQALIQDLRVGNIVSLFVSFKKDGSLLSCSLFTGEYAQIIRCMINDHCDKFTKTVMNTYDDAVGHQNHVFVFQSQSTLFIGDAMYDYTTTALFDDGTDEFKKIHPIEKIKKYGKALFIRLSGLFSKMPGKIKQLIGETICANRMESYSGNIHKELAMSYDKSSFTVLSFTSISDDSSHDSFKVFQHYMFSNIINEFGFNEPPYWNVTNVSDMDSLIQDVDGYIFKKITMVQFYESHPPSNKFKYDFVIDCEGFVVYDTLRNNSYGKIKTDCYYKSHKLRENNIQFLIELNEVAGHIFPLARIVSEVVCNVNDKMNIINQKLIDLISSDILIEELNKKNTKAAHGLESRPKNIKFKIIINNLKDEYTKLAFIEFQNLFPSLNALTEEMKTFIVSYSMRSELWLDIPKPIDDELKSLFVTQLISM